MFADRRAAGRALARRLEGYARNPAVVVLGLPRGGVPVATEVARALGAPLDVFVVRKLGVPGHEELALGAIASGGIRVLNDDVIKAAGVSPEELDAVTSSEAEELERRERLYRGDRPPVEMCGRTAIVVDDGLATGATMRAAVAAVRATGASSIVVAVPTASRQAAREMAGISDVFVCVSTPRPFVAVGMSYEDFRPTSDEEVQRLLADLGDHRPMNRGVRNAAALALVFFAVAAGSAQAVSPPPFSDGDGVHVTIVKRLGPRLFALTLTTPLLTAPTNLRVLLPDDYEARANRSRRYPVLYLFHGTSGGANDWTEKGNALQATAGLPLIVVMPDAGINSDGGGWFTDWVNGGAYGPPKWETWHIDHLIPWVDTQLRTIAARRGRAIAGLSQGGFGAMSYAARHPDLFQAAISFSGAVDIAANGLIADPLVTPIVLATEVGLDRVAPFTFFGDRGTNEINWAAHDPATLAGNLRGMKLYAYTGNGFPGPLDTGDNQWNAGAAAIESGVHTLTTLFKQELDARGIPISYHDYGGGTHSWPYWNRDLSDVIGPLMHDFARPRPQPARVDYMSDQARYAQWGWDVAMTRPAREFSTLQDAGRKGFALRGSGRAVVTTPPLYKPRSLATITRDGTAVRDTVTQRVGRDGRLAIEVPLGRANSAQQFTLGASTLTYTTTVGIDAQPIPRNKKKKR